MSRLDIWRGLDEPRSILDPIGGMDRDFDRLFNEMNRMLTPLRGSAVRAEDMMVSPPCDVVESDTNYMLSFDIPGVSKEDLNIEVSGHQLEVSGERTREDVQREGTSRRVEKRYGRFYRSFALPQDARLDDLQARYENGVLHIEIPKSDEAKPKRIPISEGKGGFFKKLLGKESESSQEAS